MDTSKNPIIEAYSRRAIDYAGEDNSASCWGRLSENLWSKLDINPDDRLVADIGCGPGATLAHLAGCYPQTTQLIGIEPASDMRKLGRTVTAPYPNITICDGNFEAIPLESETVDYLYSIMVFHWVTDANQAASEIGRVLKRTGSADIFFVGRWNGREFINKTTPIFLRYMGAAQLFAAAGLRKQYTVPETLDLFKQAIPDRPVQVQEGFKTYYDTLDGHWRWWMRIEGQLAGIPQSRRAQCEEDVRNALQQMEEPQGIPYTVHLLHAKIECK
jgi:ubiquinone/menaquinone biosynthesis C-methylase UbiE